MNLVVYLRVVCGEPRCTLYSILKRRSFKIVLCRKEKLPGSNLAANGSSRWRRWRSASQLSAPESWV
jgi:hypothetical protein